MVTDTKTNNLRVVLHQIYVSLYVEYGKVSLRLRTVGDLRAETLPVVKNPLSPVEHPGGLGVNCQLFELGVEQFVVSILKLGSGGAVLSIITDCFSPELIHGHGSLWKRTSTTYQFFQTRYDHHDFLHNNH